MTGPLILACVLVAIVTVLTIVAWAMLRKAAALDRSASERELRLRDLAAQLGVPDRQDHQP